MLNEFALDPEVISDWQSFRYFIENFGVSEGRLISRFPRDWKRLVYEAIDRNQPTPIKRLKFVEKLNSIDNSLIRKSREYDKEKDWLDNAVEQNQINPFHAIITKEEKVEAENLLLADDVAEENELWKTHTQKVIFRRPEIMAETVRVLLTSAKHILFIDPHFSPQADRFYRPLKHFLNCALHENNRIQRIEYHLKDDDSKPPFDEEYIENCERNIAPLMPVGYELKIIRWKKRVGGKKFHARYILTEKGGILFENGLDEGADADEKTPVVLLKPELYKEIWNDFQKSEDLEKCTYELDNEITVVGNKN